MTSEASSQMTACCFLHALCSPVLFVPGVRPPPQDCAVPSSTWSHVGSVQTGAFTQQARTPGLSGNCSLPSSSQLRSGLALAVLMNQGKK